VEKAVTEITNILLDIEFTISGNLGADAREYQEKLVKKALKEVQGK
jgi:hypothetical protein